MREQSAAVVTLAAVRELPAENAKAIHLTTEKGTEKQNAKAQGGKDATIFNTERPRRRDIEKGMINRQVAKKYR